MEFVIKNKIGRSHRNMTALRFILLTETLVRSVHETGDLTGNLLRRVGIRLDRFGGQLVTSDDATDLRELNAVLLGNLEDDFRISEFTAPVDDQASQLTGLHAEMSASKPHHDFSRVLTEKGNLAKNGFLLLGLLPCLLGLQFLLEFPDGLALNMHVFGIVCIIGDDILVGVCALRCNAGSLNRAVKGDNLEIVGGKLPEAVVNHVVADRIPDYENSLSANIATVAKIDPDGGWGSLPLEEKIEVLETIIRIECRYLGMQDSAPALELAYLEEGLLGQYDSEKDVVTLSYNYVVDSEAGGYSVIQVLCHEIYHRYQHYQVNLLQAIRYNDDTAKYANLLVLDTAGIYEDEFGSYISPDDDSAISYNMYSSQRLERDAEKYSNASVVDYYEQVCSYLKTN